MLYQKSIVSDEKNSFIFSGEPYNEDINLNEIAALEAFYKKNGYLPEKYINTFLNWLTYRARDNVTDVLDSVMDSSFAGKCAVAQSFYSYMLEKLGFEYKTFNVGDITDTYPIHALTCVSIPTIIDGEKSNKLFVLDPTFRQFCLSEENRFERYNEEKRWGVRMATPHPGYFYNLTSKGRQFANNLITYGYFEVNADNLKTYFDPFMLYVTPKEEYADEKMVGRISSTDYSGENYWNKINNSIDKPLRSSRGFDLTTPLEDLENKKKKIGYRIKKFFSNNELEEMFTIEDDSLSQEKKK